MEVKSRLCESLIVQEQFWRKKNWLTNFLWKKKRIELVSVEEDFSQRPWYELDF